MPKEKNIKILVYEPGKAPEERTIPNTLEAMKEVIGGGWLEGVYVGPGGIYLMCDEDGKMKNLPYNRPFRGGDHLVGTVFITKVDKEGDNISLLPSDIVYWMERL